LERLDEARHAGLDLLDEHRIDGSVIEAAIADDERGRPHAPRCRLQLVELRRQSNLVMLKVTVGRRYRACCYGRQHLTTLEEELFLLVKQGMYSTGANDG